MADQTQVIETIADVHAKLIALEAVTVSTPELIALHESLANARALAVDHFEIPEEAARGGGHDKPPTDPNDPGDEPPTEDPEGGE